MLVPAMVAAITPGSTPARLPVINLKKSVFTEPKYMLTRSTGKKPIMRRKKEMKKSLPRCFSIMSATFGCLSKSFVTIAAPE